MYNPNFDLYPLYLCISYLIAGPCYSPTPAYTHPHLHTPTHTCIHPPIYLQCCHLHFSCSAFTHSCWYIFHPPPFLSVDHPFVHLPTHSVTYALYYPSLSYLFTCLTIYSLTYSPFSLFTLLPIHSIIYSLHYLFTLLPI